MGFVADTPTQSEIPIVNGGTGGGFWPDIDPQHCRSVMRLDQSITPERLRDALVNAMLAINLDNAVWGAQQQVDGHATLADVSDQQLDEKNVNVSLYQRAVYCRAKADLLERYADYDSTGSGNQRADQLNASVDDYRRQSINAIGHLTGSATTGAVLL
tara:strand:+ start:2736 stop:3209 length:474 start_codon:yes stop_codon:yes gene_type:complete